MRRSKRRYIPLTFRVTFALIMREMATTHGKSAFGYLWAVLEPIGGIAMLSLAFSLALRGPSLGDSFPLFYATGYIPFAVYSVMQQRISGSIQDNRQLLFYPRVTFLDAILSRFILGLVTQLLVAFVIYTGIVVIFEIRFQFEVGPIVGAIFLAAMLGLGVGSINAVIIYHFPSWRNLWGIITRPIFLMSCIFYLYDSMPTWAQTVLWFNPIIHMVGFTRMGFYEFYGGEHVSLFYPATISAISLLFGLIFLSRYANDMINN